MRKFLIAATIAAMAAAPAAGLAHGNRHNDIQDGTQCRASSDPVTLKVGVQSHGTPDPEDVDRASLCVKNGNSTVLYVGGEARSESNPGEQTGVACGAVIVADTNRAGGTEGEGFNQTGNRYDHCD